MAEVYLGKLAPMLGIGCIQGHCTAAYTATVAMLDGKGNRSKIRATATLKRNVIYHHSSVEYTDHAGCVVLSLFDISIWFV